MALCKFRHLVPVQYSYPSASFSSFPLYHTTIFCMSFCPISVFFLFLTHELNKFESRILFLTKYSEISKKSEVSVQFQCFFLFLTHELNKFESRILFFDKIFRN